MSQTPDPQPPQPPAIVASPLYAAAPVPEGVPPAPAGAPVHTDADAGEMWIQL